MPKTISPKEFLKEKPFEMTREFIEAIREDLEKAKSPADVVGLIAFSTLLGPPTFLVDIVVSPIKIVSGFLRK